MLNKQWWTAERKSKLGVLTQTKLLCKSSLGSLVRKKPSHLRETTQRTEVWQKGKKRDCYIYFFLQCSHLLRKVRPQHQSEYLHRCSVHTTARTEKGGENKGQQEQKLLDSSDAKVLRVRNDVKMSLLCCCCSNYTISTTFPPPPAGNIPEQRSCNRLCGILKSVVSPVMRWVFFLSSRGVEGVSAAAALRMNVHTVSNTVTQTVGHSWTFCGFWSDEVFATSCWSRKHPLRFSWPVWSPSGVI